MINMPWLRPKQVELSAKQETILRQLSNGTHNPLHLKIRSQIVLLASQGRSTSSIAKEMKLEYTTVQRWRDRYSKAKEELSRTEVESPHKTRSAIIAALSDEQRSGGPPKFTNDQVAAILAMACEDPLRLELPFSHWTPELLQIEVVKLGIVPSISVRQIGRFLKRERFTTASNSVLVKS
jgi:putative transposase